MNQRPKWTLVHKARNIQFSTGFLSVFYRFFKCVGDWGSAVLCCCLRRWRLTQKSGRKLEAPPRRKLVENWRSETGKQMECGLKNKLKKKTAWQFGAPNKYIYIYIYI